MRKSGAFDELHHEAVKAVGLFFGFQRTIDSCVECSKIHHQLMRKFDELGAPRSNIGCKRFLNHLREEVALVVHQCFAAEQTILKSAAGAMFVAVQIDENAIHHYFASVVKRLFEIFVAVNLFGVVEGSYGKHVHDITPSPMPPSTARTVPVTHSARIKYSIPSAISSEVPMRPTA